MNNRLLENEQLCFRHCEVWSLWPAGIVAGSYTGVRWPTVTQGDLNTVLDRGACWLNSTVQGSVGGRPDDQVVR